MRRTARELLETAYGRYALGAFNVCNMEQVHGLFHGATRARAPIIVQFTRVIRDYGNPVMLQKMLEAAELIYPEVEFAVHLDHGDEPTCAEGIASKFYSSVMIDASYLPFAENVAITRRVVERAHAHGVWVEAELGMLQGIEEGAPAHARDMILTDPAQAEEFVRTTGCDSLAVAIGTSHGAYKFAGNQRLQLDRLAEIQKRLPKVPLVLHGGSAVPAEEVLRINRAGGALSAGAGGVADSELRQSIPLGITKVNIGTDGRLIWTRVHREFFQLKPKEFDFMPPGRSYMEEFALFVSAKTEILASAGQAGKSP